VMERATGHDRIERRVHVFGFKHRLRPTHARASSKARWLTSGARRLDATSDLIYRPHRPRHADAQLPA
jgi:hypothetical protein